MAKGSAPQRLQGPALGGRRSSLGRPGASWGVGREGAAEKINVGGKGTSGNSPSQRGSGFSTPKQKFIRAGQKNAGTKTDGNLKPRKIL